MRKNIYKKGLSGLTISAFILSLSLFLYGCPYNSSYKIDPEPLIPADETLVGKWSTIISTETDNQPLRMLVSKKNDYEYNLDFVGRINGLRNFSVLDKDTLRASAYFSDAASRRFLNIDIKGQTYIAEFIYKNDKITLLPLCEHFTSKIIKNDTELKTALEYHYKTRLYPLYDDEFSIRELQRVKDLE